MCKKYRMMNNIYDFSQIQTMRYRQNKLILSYILYTLCFAVALVLSCYLVKSNLLLTIIFALLLLFFILFSIVFWKIKYGILNEYKLFLDNMEMGNREDYVGVFTGKVTSQSDEEPFDTYLFVSSNKKTSFLIHNQHPVQFSEGKRYHIEHVGSYVYQWEIIE